MAVAGGRGRTFGGGNGALRGAFGGARGLAGILGLAPCGIGHIALVLARLLDAGPFGGAGGREPDRLGIDARLLGGLFDDDAVDLLAELGQPVALAEAHGGGRGRAGTHRVAVPAPHRAVARDQLLARLQGRLQSFAGHLVGNEADEGDAARELRQGRHMRGQRRRTFREFGGIGQRLQRQPVHRRPAIGRGFQFVAERGAERLFQAGLDREGVEQRRPERVGGRLQRGGDARFLGPQLGQARVGLLHDLDRGRVARLGSLALGRTGALHVDALGFRLGHGQTCRVRFVARCLARALDCLLPLAPRLLEGCPRRFERGLDLVQRRQTGEFRLDLPLLGRHLVATDGHAAQPALQLGQLAAHALAQRLVVGDLSRQAVVFLFRRGRVGLGGIARLSGGGGTILLAHLLLLQPAALGVEIGDRRLRVALAAAFTCEIRVGLLQAGLGLELGLRHALGFGGQRIVRHAQALQRGGGGGFLVAQRRQAGRGLGLRGGGKAHQAGEIGDQGLGFPQALARTGEVALGGGELERQHRRLGTADVVRQVAIAAGLAGLALEALVLLLEGHEHVLHARQVLLGGAQPELGLVAARVEAGDAGGLVDDGATVGRLGIDQRADASLAHQRGRARSRRRIGKQRLHVTGTDFATVHRIGRAVAAFDAADDVELVGVVHHGGRGAGLVVQRQHHLGDVARRTGAGAGEDDVLHLRAAHLLGRGLAHHPLERLDQVRLAAAVGPDDASHSRLDDELRRIDEGLEAGEPELVELDHLHHVFCDYLTTLPSTPSRSSTERDPR